MSDSRIRWQCRRGMRELDVLLQGYFDRRYAAAGEGEKSAFRALLALPDPALVAYLLHGEPVEDEALADVVRRVRERDFA
ncbi:MAG TPA: succinate dehydrogenase assembly factor 2 [Woeseiaceae bacterium]|nr:succinate dehydrogenase assembly factor 2 [Woeseiaceae bacterium]